MKRIRTGGKIVPGLVDEEICALKTNLHQWQSFASTGRRSYYPPGGIGLFPSRAQPPQRAPGYVMMKHLTMSDINAYLDGALNEDRRREIEEAIRSDIEAAALLQQYRQQVQELHRIYDTVLKEPVPGQMLDLLRRKRGDDDAD